jgi:hypothetical protein
MTKPIFPSTVARTKENGMHVQPVIPSQAITVNSPVLLVMNTTKHPWMQSTEAEVVIPIRVQLAYPVIQLAKPIKHTSA